MSIIVYAVLALAVMGMIGTGVYKVKQWGGDEVRAELLPKLESCQAEITKQNAAVAALAAEGARKLKEASTGVAKAKAGTQAARTEAERLRVLAGATVKPGACPAAEGVAIVREGLK